MGENAVQNSKGYSIYSDFDIEKHKANYVNYLEVLILSDGTIKYAVPSHQELAISLACKKLGVTRDELCKMTPIDFYCDWLKWLCSKAEVVSVWNDYIVYDSINKTQYNKLKLLKLNGLYKGILPKNPAKNL